MTENEQWAHLILRLEDDLQRRAQPVSVDAEQNPWKEVRLRLERMARLMAAPADIEDVVQTLLLRLQSLEVLHRIKASRSPKAYATMMVRNAVVDTARRRQYALQRFWAPMAEVSEPDDELQRRHAQAQLQNLLLTLNDSERELLRLRFWEDLSMAEIARRLDLPYSTVAVRMFRLLQRLRDKGAAL